MRFPRTLSLLPLTVFAILLTSLAHADFQAGQDAYERGDYATALKEWQPLAEAGNGEAAERLGILYFMGEGVPKDNAEAFRWYHLAAEQGRLHAQATLALSYETGRGLTKEKDLREAFRLYSNVAEQSGEAIFQKKVGDFYTKGQGVPQDYAQGRNWYRKAAEQGDADAQFTLGILYDEGRGVPQDYVQAVKWYRKAAEQGDADAQAMLGFQYQLGQGVPQDYVQAHMWFNLAAAKLNDENSNKARDSLASLMTPAQLAEAQRLARQWEPKTGSAPTRQPDTDETQPVASGTGFVVSREGHVLTNHHVIDGCKTIRTHTEGRMHLLTVVGTDAKNDLAILTLPAPVSGVARFREGRTIRPGDGVVVVGFPLHGLLASEANVTTGTVSALAGIGNDTRFLQITAPVQSGNSGGPLLDEGGHIVGLIVSKLNAMHIAKATGDIPQNINFAIKDTVAKSFLDSQSVEYETETSTTTLEIADIGAAAKTFTLLLECHR